MTLPLSEFENAAARHNVRTGLGATKRINLKGFPIIERNLRRAYGLLRLIAVRA